MALTRRSVRVTNSIWPGFVDAMTALLLVLMFVLTIFMILQYVLQETIHGQEDELDELATEITSLAQALGLEQQRAADLEDSEARLTQDLSAARDQIDSQSTLIATLSGQIASQEEELAARAARITSFEAQVASLLSERDDALAAGERLAADVSELEAAQDQLISEQEALQLALAQARDEIDAQVEEARLAAARREALEALTADLRAESEGLQEQLDDAEAARLADAAAAEALRERLQNADAELTAMSLNLEEQRQRAEETLTLLAAARAAEEDLTNRLAQALADRAALDAQVSGLEVSREDLSARLAQALEAQRAQAGDLADLTESEEELAARIEALSASEEELRRQLTAALAAEAGKTDEVAALMRDEEALRDRLAAALAAKVEAEAAAESGLSEAERMARLLSQANTALAAEEEKSAEGQRRIAVLNEQIAALRSQLGSLQSLLDAAAESDADAKVQIDALGSQLNAALARAAAEERRRAELEAAERERLEAETQDLERYRSEFFGQLRDLLGNREGIQIVGDRFVFSSEVLFALGSAQLSAEGRAQIAEVAGILSDVADQIPSGIDWILRVDGHTDNQPIFGGVYANNWELSQARALSVVLYMIEQLGFPPDRLAATGFGEFRPVNPADTPGARAQNRRIELKLTER